MHTPQLGNGTDMFTLGCQHSVNITLVSFNLVQRWTDSYRASRCSNEHRQSKWTESFVDQINDRRIMCARTSFPLASRWKLSRASSRRWGNLWRVAAVVLRG